MITIENRGPLIAATNYWASELNRIGGFFLSPNAGTLRLLVPSGWEAEFLRETFAAREVLVSRGYWTAESRDAIELLWEDDTSDPFSLHVAATQCVPLIAAEEHGREFPLAIWIRRHGEPKMARTQKCRFRVVELLPFLKPWSE